VIGLLKIKTCRKTAVEEYSTFLQSGRGTANVRQCSISSHTLEHLSYSFLRNIQLSQ